MIRTGLVLVLLAGCKGPEDPPLPALTDTGWFDNTANYGTTGCTARFQGSVPENDAVDWYYRDALQVQVEAADPKAYWVQLLDAAGGEVQVSTTWSGEGLKLDILPLQPLEPLSDYTLVVQDCADVTEVEFTTSVVGQPLTVDPEELVGVTWSMEMLEADWHEPAGAEALILLYFSAPALLGVRHADEQMIDVMGAAGVLDGLGNLEQAAGSTWNFPPADFTSSPFFSSDATLVTLVYDGVAIPVHNAHLEATIDPDGEGISGGKLSGLGDTRDLGGLLAAGDDPDALCNLAAGLGVVCEACPDGGEYCLPLSATRIHGERIEGLTLIPSFD